MVKILITGSLGGIGSRLYSRLKLLGYSVRGIDNFSNTGESIDSEIYSETLRVDIAHEQHLVREAVRDVDLVVHLAALSSLAECQLNPALAFGTNLMASRQIAEEAMKAGAQFIFASSSAVYEGIETPELSEDQIVSPYLVYPQTKYMSEMVLRSLHELHGYPSTSFRFFNVFGEQQGQSRAQPPLVNYLYRELAAGKVPKIFAPSTQARDYVYVEDVVEAIICRIAEPSKSFEVYNVGSGHPLTISQILSAVAKGLGKEQIDFKQSSPEKMWDGFGELFESSWPLKKELVRKEVLKSSKASIKKIYTELGWTPRTSVLKAIESYAASLAVEDQKG